MSAQPEVDFEQVGAWIRKSAAEKSLDEILASVRSRFDDLYGVLSSVPESGLHTQSGDDEWAPIDAFKHLVEWNWQVGEDILHVSLTGERPGNPPPVFDAALEALTTRSRESLDSVWAHVSAADPEGFLHVTWEHEFFGELNWREWFFFLGVHAIDHTRQVRAMLEAPGA